MFKNLFLFALLTSLNSMAQTDSGSFYLHKFAQNIGKETYKRTRNGDTFSYDISFKFIDRGSPVPLQSQLITNAKGEASYFFIKGSTSRFSTIYDSIDIGHKKVFIKVNDSTRTENSKPVSFPVGGYSPGTVQMLLLQYWKKHGEPKSIPLLPSGSAGISRQGKDTLTLDGKKLILTRYVISGLIWGNELVWTDAKDNLICLITNDAEGDKLEMMQTDHESLLPELISRAATYGMKLFTGSMKMDTRKNETIFITGGTIIDVEGNKTIPNEGGILLRDGKIVKLGEPGAPIRIPAGATMINASGKFILPGLWDMHAHFEQAEWGPAYLAAGVTTVRDCGNEFGYINAIKSAIDSHKGVGPLILKAGIVDGPGARALGIVRATTKEEAVKVVNMYKDNGFVQIKIYSSVKPDIVKAIAEEAHRLGLSVTGHIPEGMTTRAGIDSGMDQVNHIQYVYGMMKKNKDFTINLDDSANKAAIRFLKDHHTVIDATVGVFEMSFRSTRDNILDMEPNFYQLPAPLQVLFVNVGMEPEQAPRYKPLFQTMLSLVKTLHDNDITVVAGTDMGFPGWSVFRELELYVQAGLTPMQAIQTATIVPAQVMKMDQQSGSLKEGKNADLLILDSDPLQSIRNIRTVWKVIKEGQVYDPNALHKMVGFK